MEFIIVIPARYASTRFPGKPLVSIKGKPMIQLTYEQAKKAFSQVVVATDDVRIFEAVQSFGGQVVMTSEQHQSGTDRCFDAWQQLEKQGFKADVLINLQGDEPFIKPEQLQELALLFQNQATEIATLGKKITDSEALFNPNVVKLLKSPDGKALYFSRATIPYLRNIPQKEWLHAHTFFKHIGLYAYRIPILKKITQLPPSILEQSESLEQLRWLENDFHIQVAETAYESLGIDTPEDLQKI